DRFAEARRKAHAPFRIDGVDELPAEHGCSTQLMGSEDTRTHFFPLTARPYGLRPTPVNNGDSDISAGSCDRKAYLYRHSAEICAGIARRAGWHSRRKGLNRGG